MLMAEQQARVVIDRLLSAVGTPLATGAKERATNSDGAGPTGRKERWRIQSLYD